MLWHRNDSGFIAYICAGEWIEICKKMWLTIGMDWGESSSKHVPTLAGLLTPWNDSHVICLTAYSTNKYDILVDKWTLVARELNLNHVTRWSTHASKRSCPQVYHTYCRISSPSIQMTVVQGWGGPARRNMLLLLSPQSMPMVQSHLLAYFYSLTSTYIGYEPTITYDVKATAINRGCHRFAIHGCTFISTCGDAF